MSMSETGFSGSRESAWGPKATLYPHSAQKGKMPHGYDEAA